MHDTNEIEMRTPETNPHDEVLVTLNFNHNAGGGTVAPMDMMDITEMVMGECHRIYKGKLAEDEMIGYSFDVTADTDGGEVGAEVQVSSTAWVFISKIGKED